MEILFLTFKIIIVLFFVGSGFTYIFIPRILKVDAFWIVPWFGIILIALLGVIFSLAQIPMNMAKNMILLVSISLLIYALLSKKIYIKISKEFLLVTLFTIITLCFNLFPLIEKAGFPTTISLGNLDPLSYTPVADFLVNQTVLDGKDFVHYKPTLWAIGDLLHYSYRWGSPMILSFFSVLFNMRSYQIFSVLLITFFALTYPLIYLLAKKLCIIGSKYLLVIIFLTYSLNSTILYMLYNVFFAQFAFTGIFVLIAILIYSYFNENKQSLHFNSYDLLIAITFSSLTTIYPESLLFILLPLCFLILFNLFNRNRTFFIVSIAKILFLTFIMNPHNVSTTMYQNLKIIRSSSKAAYIGWENIPFAAPFDMMGFYNLYHSKDLPIIFDIILAIPIILIWYMGLIKSKSKVFLLSYLATFIPFYVYFRFILPNFFSYHRTITYSLFLYSILFSIGTTNLLRNLQHIKILRYLLIFIIVGLSLRSGYRTFYQFYWHPRIVDKSLISLNELNKNKEINDTFFTSDVYLGEYDLWKRLWREYFLPDKLIVTMQNYPTERNFLKDIKLVLAEKQRLENDGKKITFKNIIWQNQFYLLGEIIPTEVTRELQDKNKNDL